MKDQEQIVYESLVNPFNLTGDMLEDYLDKYDVVRGREDAPNFYRGSSALRGFMLDGKIGIGATVRVYDYGRSIDSNYTLTRFGWSSSDGKTELEVEDFLDRMDNGKPIQWSFEGHEYLTDEDLQP